MPEIDSPDVAPNPNEPPNQPLVWPTPPARPPSWLRRHAVLAGAAGAVAAITVIGFLAVAVSDDGDSIAVRDSAIEVTDSAPYPPSSEAPTEDPEPTEDPTTPPPDPTAALGAELTITQDDEEVGTLVVAKQIVRARSYNDGYSRPKHGIFVSFKITFAATATSSTLDYNPFDFYVRGGDGSHFDDYEYLGKEPALDSGTLNPKERTSGWLTIDCPTHGTLVYAPNFTGGSVAEWKF